MQKLTDNLPALFTGPEIQAATRSLQTMWDKWYAWLASTQDLQNITTAPLAAVNLHAAGRSIVRLPGESETSFRNRVRLAALIHRETGTLAGLKRILTAMGLAGFTVHERAPYLEWDVVMVALNPDQLELDMATLEEVLKRFGRPTRRLIPGYAHTAQVKMRVGMVQFTYYSIPAA